MPERTSVTLHFVERGAGTPVLALHGWTPDHRLMLGCLEPVFAKRPGYRRLYPDLPGMGKSPAPPRIAGSDDMLDAVQDFIDDTIGAEPFLLVGESYGGYLSRALVRARPRQVLGLALICPPGRNLEKSERLVPERQVLRPDPELLASLDAPLAEEFADVAVVQTPTPYGGSATRSWPVSTLPTPLRWSASSSAGSSPSIRPRGTGSSTGQA